MKTELKDLILPLAVVSIVGMMIFPMPAAALDVLLMCNISFSLMLLVSSVYLSQPERFTSLPTVLLLSTLLRLGLNISTTRQLLSGGSVPEIIITFGNFVVAGNFVVGAVIFGIITVVQFVVISKGAERVAEVAARFTLDAMPGKQMSIDADIRSGILSLAEAREKRQELQREAKLYGALDGAVKFIKGDAIASIFITVINIAGGLLVGMAQQKLSLGAAAAKYALFTIGDGLASQIPAVLVSVAAGITITRVVDKEGAFLGRDLFRQLGKEPQAMGTTASVLFLLALLPGLPFIPFAAAAAMLAISAKRAAKKVRERQKERNCDDFHSRMFSGVALRVTLDAARQLQREQVFPQGVQELRRSLFETWGVVVPDLQFDIDRTGTGILTSIYLNGVDTVSVSLPGDSGRSYSEEIIDILRQFFIEHLSELINDTQTRMLLELHEPSLEDLINSVVPEMISVTALTALLRQLIREHVSVRSLGAILQAIAEHKLPKSHAAKVVPLPGLRPQQMLSKSLEDNGMQWASESAELLASVRIALKGVVSQSLANGLKQIAVWVIEPELDNMLGRSSVAGIPIDPAISQAILAALEQAEKAHPLHGVVIVMCSKYSRQVFSDLLREHFPSLRTIAPEEIGRDIKIEVLGTLGLTGIHGEGDGDINKAAAENEIISPRFRRKAAVIKASAAG